MNKKIVFIGGGYVSERMIDSLIAGHGLRPSLITVSGAASQRLGYLRHAYGVSVPEGPAADDCLKSADMIILAVQPQELADSAAQLKSVCAPDTLILSICSGVTLKTLERVLGEDKKILRVLPNTQLKIRSGYSAACVNKNITEPDKELVTEFLNALGHSMYIDESSYDTLATLQLHRSRLHL